MMSKLEKFRIKVWAFLVLLAMASGVSAGASFFAGVGLSPSVATFCLLGTGVLMLTMIALHREHPTSTTKPQGVKE